MPIAILDEKTKTPVLPVIWEGFTPQGQRMNAAEAARATGLAPGTWQEITDAEAAELMRPTLEEARAAKLAEIVTKANEVKAALSSRFSALEEGTWPEQEAGARKILNDAGNVKDKTARLILLDEASTAAAVALVSKLAETDSAATEEFASRIVNNADISYQAGIATLMEQRAFEAAAHAAETVEEINIITVQYSILAFARSL